MADSCEYIIDSVENFWKIETDEDCKDENLEILTVGVNNMYSIANCANDLISGKDGLKLKAYSTYQRLVKVLDFVFKGAQLFQHNASKSGLPEEQLKPLSKTIDDFKGVLDRLKSDLPEDIVGNKNEIPNSSAIELLLELFYKACPDVDDIIYEFAMAFEARFGKYFTENKNCGLPRVVFICYVSSGIIVTASAVKWQLSFKKVMEREMKKKDKKEEEEEKNENENENTDRKGFDRVNERLIQWRKTRFPSGSTQTAKELSKKVFGASTAKKQGIGCVLKEQNVKAFDHSNIQGGAFHVLQGAGSILKIHRPCNKCRRMYNFAYIGPKGSVQDGRIFQYGSCAEDLCHVLLENDKASDREPDTSLC